MSQLTAAERFGLRLRQLRREKSATEERDVDQTEVAKAVKETQSNVAKWEGGRIPRDDQTIKDLAAFYGVSWIWLRTGEGEKYPNSEREAPRPPATARASIGAKRTGNGGR